MNKIALKTFIAFVFLQISISGRVYSAEIVYSAKNNVFGSDLILSAKKDQYAGAIYSMTWNGKQFLNSYDHGRELQSASSFDNFGECFNPTEAGSARDAMALTSTSVLLQVATTPHQLKTTSKMAFWTPVGSGTSACTAKNTTDLSNHTLNKQVTVGIYGQNVIEYLVTFHVAESHSASVFEALTGYVVGDFSSFWSFDPVNSVLKSLSLPAYGVPSSTNLPLIFSTQDKSYAIGVYSPNLTSTSTPNGYGYFTFTGTGNPLNDTMKWNIAFWKKATPVGDYSYRAYVVVGTLAQVQIGMNVAFRAVNVPAGQSNVYRFFKPATGEHFFSTTAMEGVSAEFLAETVAFRLLNSPSVPGTIALYRCNNGFHFVSASSSCEGATSEGVYGYAYSAQQAATAPLYRFYQASTGDHLTTTNYSEGNSNGYVYEGIMGYVPYP